MEYVLDLACITANKNTVPGDKSAMKPSGLRLGWLISAFVVVDERGLDHTFHGLRRRDMLRIAPLLASLVFFFPWRKLFLCHSWDVGASLSWISDVLSASLLLSAFEFIHLAYPDTPVTMVIFYG